MTTNPYKAVFIDLDGTLLNKQSVVGERNAACIKKLVAKGVKVIFSTGRPIESVRHICGAIHQDDPVITLSGSMIHKTMFGSPMKAQTIPFETVRNILETCRDLGGVDNIMLDDEDGFYSLHENEEIEEFVGMFHKRPKVFTYDQVPSSAVLSLMIHSKANRRDIYTSLHEKFGADAHFTYFKEYPWIEISNFSSNKGVSMTHVCEAYGFQLDEVIAIGDGANDLEMIAAAGLGIAMGNADEEVKAVADRVAPHHTEDGFAVVLEEIFGL